ncbi:MAG: metal-dependent hydrolase [Thermoflavifilum sp.]|jgi:L-ascorbate metabolism protein UlaG (beta-lactamase superfamily)|uniref:metal-dependent hydrolase n=1 Tax=Thermoflavifilum sp. TaxID=1968839 RepID=UPI0018A36472|nr:metal-dependent hydrolase [Thermoflavifilum sp.]QOR76233.1 MAG: metal-dependent hydrolase [Thermoflavifilum sp.]
MKLTYYGHACFAVQIGQHHILFDPFITPNELAKHIDIHQIPADYILISHGHADHVADVAAIAKRTGATLVSNFEIIEWFQAQGFQKVHPMNHGGSWQFDFGKVKYVNAIHSSKLPDGANGGNPGGFICQTSEGNFYYSGDTALTLDMQLIPRFARIDFAIFPIGDNFTMGYEDALVAAELVQTERVVGVHYDTFGYIKIDKDAARKAFQEAGRQLLLPAIGETIEL